MLKYFSGPRQCLTSSINTAACILIAGLLVMGEHISLYLGPALGGTGLWLPLLPCQDVGCRMWDAGCGMQDAVLPALQGCQICAVAPACVPWETLLGLLPRHSGTTLPQGTG